MANTAPKYREFITMYPQFVSLDEPNVVQPQLTLSSLLIASSSWGEFFSYAVALDAAHNLTLNIMASGGELGALQGAAGPMTNVSAAGMNAGFQALDINGKAASEKYYSKTVYGQAFLRLRSAVISCAMLTTNNAAGFSASIFGPAMPMLPFA